jgi:hypothetical protein
MPTGKIIRQGQVQGTHTKWSNTFKVKNPERDSRRESPEQILKTWVDFASKIDGEAKSQSIDTIK